MTRAATRSTCSRSARPTSPTQGLGASAGTGWSFSVGQWVYADTQPDGSVVVREPGGADHAYIKKATTPSFATPGAAKPTAAGSTRRREGHAARLGPALAPRQGRPRSEERRCCVIATHTGQSAGRGNLGH